ncbi:MAG TPA: PTS sugar transporter subunit IIA [Rhodopila sp.]|nr:PTS sugar transporter subunit IIA [Rhodopila sp.]
MEITDFLTPDRVVFDIRARDKRQLIAEAAQRFARSVLDLNPATVEAALLQREQLGSTGLGNGFALPHARIEGLDRFLGLFIRLVKPIAFDAIDGKPVQLVFVLLIPADSAVSHLAPLAAISRRFRDADVVAAVLRAPTTMAAYGILAGAGAMPPAA